jgi:hypothetical protein
MAMSNHALAEMESVVGLPGLFPRIQVPQMPPSGPITFNNFKLDNSTVGSINTGNVRDIDVNIGELRKAGNEKAVAALHDFTDAIIKDKSLTPEQKNELLDQVAFLSGQATAPAKERKSGMIKATLAGISQGASVVTSVAGAWQAAEPILKALLGS